MKDEYLQDLLQAEHPSCSSKKRKMDGGKKSMDCDCSSPSPADLAFDTQGCLKCPKTDCAYYVQNFIETFLYCHSVDIYHIGTS